MNLNPITLIKSVAARIQYIMDCDTPEPVVVAPAKLEVAESIGGGFYYHLVELPVSPVPRSALCGATVFRNRTSCMDLEHWQVPFGEKYDFQAKWCPECEAKRIEMEEEAA